MSGKRVEFHQADIRVTVRIIDGERSYGVRQFNLSALMNTSNEWEAVVEQINKAIADLHEQIQIERENADSS